MVPCNLRPDLQRLESKEMCLDFDSVESVELSLMERARVYVKLLCAKQRSVKDVKHGTTRHATLDTGVLPSKSVLIALCKRTQVEWEKFNFPHLRTIKDKLVLSIFISHKVSQTESNFNQQQQISPTKILAHFKSYLHQRSKLQDEFEQLTQDQQAEYLPCPTLEVGTILTLIYASC